MNKSLPKFAKTSYTLRHLEYISQCIKHNESLLLIGETGVGKTFILQLLSTILKQELIVINLSFSTDSTDLFGTFRPVTSNSNNKQKVQVITNLVDEFKELFSRCFSIKENKDFINFGDRLYNKQLFNI